MNGELADRTEWDRSWRALEIRTQGQVTQSDRELEPGDVIIIPGIPRERPSELHVMVEKHKLCIRWEWARLGAGDNPAFYPDPLDPEPEGG